jgi:hypothetical protein
MKKFLLLPLFFLVFSGCATDYNSVAPTPQTNQSNTAIIETSTKQINVVTPNTVKESPKVQIKTVTPARAVTAPVVTCCKHCSKGKACGDSCISRSYTCHKAPGCACDY